MPPPDAIHEARTYFNAVLLSLRNLKRKVQADPELVGAVEEAEEQARKSTKALERLIAERPQAATSGLSAKACAPKEIVTEAVGAVSKWAAEKNQPIVVQEHLAALPEIVVDRFLIVRALVNLLENAIKFSPEGEAIQFRAKVRCNDGHPALVFTIADRGIGISPERADRLLQPGGWGEGLGLAISKQIAEAHGGRLWVEIKNSPGATVSLALPLQKTGNQRRAEGRRMRFSEGMSERKPLRIFLVEDDEDMRRMLKRYLEEEGHTVDQARTVAEAVEGLARGGYDLFLSDLSLSDGTGWDILEKVDLPAATQAVALSGRGTEMDKARSAAAGFHEHLVKPIDPDVLDDLLARVAANRGQA